jgi:hypothetical protein
MSRRRYSQYSCGRSVYHFQSYHGFANFAFVNNEGTHCERGARLDGDADSTIEAFSDHICHGVTQMQINALESLSSADASVKETAFYNLCENREPFEIWQPGHDYNFRNHWFHRFLFLTFSAVH